MYPSRYITALPLREGADRPPTTSPWPWTRGSHGQQEAPVLVTGALLVSQAKAPSRSNAHASKPLCTVSPREAYREKIRCCWRSSLPGLFSVKT